MNRRKNALAWERQEKLQIEAFEAKRRLAQAEKKEMYQLSDDSI